MKLFNSRLAGGFVELNGEHGPVVTGKESYHTHGLGRRGTPYAKISRIVD